MLKLPPPVWCVTYLLLAAGLSALLGWPPGPHSMAVGAALVLVGMSPPVWAALLFRRAGTEFQPTSPANKALITDGPYAFTRNPMYLGLVVATLGVSVFVGAWPMLLAPVALFLTANFVHIPFEEAKMRRQFGEAFDAYARRVRRWL
jgi:protein-S-isoprenylcysteine O-methyltransferase Ste14